MYNFEGNKPMSQVLYINGVKRNATPLEGNSFYADCDGSPMVYCSQHRIGASAIEMLKNGYLVKASGNEYSLKPTDTVIA